MPTNTGIAWSIAMRAGEQTFAGPGQGLYLDDVQVDGDRIELRGYADSNRQIAAYMRSLDLRVGKPDLKQIATASRDGKPVSEFLIRIKR